MNGTINIFKPRGFTSHDVVNIMRGILKTSRIGHTGTLDPGATGVLPLCIGKGTRISEYLLNSDKEYIGELTLGIATDTHDMFGKAIKSSTKSVCTDDIYNVFEEFKGELDQIPPMYSALKHRGKRLYELARKGTVVKRPPRKIRIFDLKIKNIMDNKKILFSVRCSSGTYIRTLCHDIGGALGTYGYMSYLIRTSAGDFKLKDSYSLDYLRGLKREKIEPLIKPIEKSLNHLNSIAIEGRFYKRLTNGNIIHINDYDLEHKDIDIPLKIYCADIFIGIGRIIKNENMIKIKMDKVLI